MAALAAAKWCDFLENGLTARWTARQPAAQRCTAPPAAAETPEDRQTCPASSVSCHSRAVFAHGRGVASDHWSRSRAEAQRAARTTGEGGTARTIPAPPRRVFASAPRCPAPCPPSRTPRRPCSPLSAPARHRPRPSPAASACPARACEVRQRMLPVTRACPSSPSPPYLPEPARPCPGGRRRRHGREGQC